MVRASLDLTSWLVAFAPLVSQRVWRYVPVLVAGAILAPGQRTITSVLRVMGLENDAHFPNYPRVLNRAVWSSRQGSRVLLNLLVTACAPSGPLMLGLDDTLERRWGATIKARGIYRDPVRASRSHVVKASGLCWLSLMLLVPIPWAQRGWALPFLTVLSPSERYPQERGQRHQMLLQVRRGQLAHPITAVTRLRLDAARYEPAYRRCRCAGCWSAIPTVNSIRKPACARNLRLIPCRCWPGSSGAGQWR